MSLAHTILVWIQLYLAAQLPNELTHIPLKKNCNLV